MIKYLAQRKYWEIAVVGLISSVTIMLLLAGMGRWARDTWPTAGEGIGIAYLIIASAAAWISVGIFIEAAFYKGRKERAEFLRDEALDAISDLYCAFKIEPGLEYNGRYTDEYPDETDPDALAEAYGLTEKEAERG
jgi:hypothetical protein